MILHSAVNREVLCCLTTRCVLTYNVCSLCCRTETRPANLHPLPDFGAGKGVPYESLPHEATKDRNGTPTLPDRATDQDLVSEPKNEAQKGDSGHQGAERARETGSSLKAPSFRGWWA